MNCPNCGAANPDETAFCGECGASIQDRTPKPEARALPAAAEGVVRCRNCGAENTAGAVFCSTCRSVLDTPPAGGGILGSLRSRLKPHTKQATAARLAGQQVARLPKRCPSCGGPVYPDEARCSRCGVDPVAAALAEASIVPQDADGHDLPDMSNWGRSGPRLRDHIPERYRPVYDVIVVIVELLVEILRVLLQR